MSTASRSTGRRKVAQPWRPSPVTFAIGGIVLLVVLISMWLTLFAGWPFTQPTGVTVKPGSPYAGGLKVSIVGTPVESIALFTDTTSVQNTPTTVTNTVRTITTTVQIVNEVHQSPQVVGTPTPNAPTPGPEPAKVLNASVKVLFYDSELGDVNKKIVGSGIGNYYNAAGLEPGGTATLDVVAIGVGDYKSYEAFADGLWTDKDPLKTPEPLSLNQGPHPAMSLNPTLRYAP